MHDSDDSSHAECAVSPAWFSIVAVQEKKMILKSSVLRDCRLRRPKYYLRYSLGESSGCKQPAGRIGIW